MPEVRDPAIKLFGRNIPVSDCRRPDSDTHIPAAAQVAMDECRESTNKPIQKSGKYFPSSSDEGRENNHRISCQESELEGNHDPAEEQEAPNDLNDIESVLKKPDKILPCPRCHSWDTKFCYFNNRNVNQPRHFCKNCHRYWTAGGTMRNVPVGAGRRRNKHSRPAEGIREVLKFGRDAPLCESMAASLNLRDTTISVKLGTATAANHGEEPSSSGCSFTSTTVHDNELPETQEEKVGFHGHYDCTTSEHPQLAYPWNPGWNTTMFSPNSNNPIPNIVSTGSPPMMAISSFCPPSITIPFMPASYWGCMPSWDGRNWNFPFVATTGCLSPSSSASNSCSGNNSPTLGKHSRDASLQAEEKTEQSLWIPKTLRIDDLDEAAKSSIWDTLGIKTGNTEPIKKGGIFKAFRSKPEPVSRTSDADAGQVLQANPAAFSRSQTFQENT